MPKTKVLLLLAICCALTSTAQEPETAKKNPYGTYNNQVKLHLSGFGTPGWFSYDMSRVRQWGFSYERKVYRNWHAGIGFQKWFYMGLTSLAGGSGDPSVTPNLLSRTGADAEMTMRERYKMIDAYVYYKLNLWKQRHFINAGAGFFVSWGTDHFRYRVSDHWGWHTSEYVDHEEPMENYGFMPVPMLSYDFMCLRNRLNIGADFRIRNYLNTDFRQVDYGIHVGVNF